MKRVYFAGKVRHGKKDWRNQLFNCDRIGGASGSDVDNDLSIELDKERRENIIKDGYRYNGPYFFSCDHGCYHGESSHGQGAMKGTLCCGIYEVDESIWSNQVFNSCLHDIRNSDIIFAWIDSEDAFGTIFELGYAHSLGKEIFIAMNERFLETDFSGDMWFILKAAKHMAFTKNVTEAWECFLKRDKEYYSYVFDANENAMTRGQNIYLSYLFKRGDIEGFDKRMLTKLAATGIINNVKSFEQNRDIEEVFAPTFEEDVAFYAELLSKRQNEN